MSFKNVDIDAALRRIADRRIEEAMEAGKFDRIEGQGKPLDLEPMPAEEDQRLMWWALRILKQNDVVPHEVQWRKEVDVLKAQLATTTDAAARGGLVRRINDLVRKVNTLGTNALQGDLAPVDEPPGNESSGAV
jgi:hypothetical protein